MKNIIISLALIFTSIIICGQSPTLLGVHGSNSPTTIESLGAQIARYGFTDYKIKNGIISGNREVLVKARKLDSLEVKQVIFLTWPDTTSVDEYERVPTGTDRVEVLQYLDILIDNIGQYVEYIQISQEPFGATSYDPNEPIADIMNWWKAVALFIRNKQIINPDDFGHIKLIAGGLTGVTGAINNPYSQVASLIDSVISFSEAYCDVIDIHLHLVDISMGEDIISYIKSKTNLPIVCTEWSQAKAASPKGTNWINSVNTVFFEPHIYDGLTNGKIIDTSSSDNNQMDSSEWDMLIAISPYTTNFIPDFYAVMESNCFEFACYASPFQYGSPTYDWVQLFATKTVIQNNYPNNPFNSEFVNLAYLLNNDLFTTKCPTVGVVNEYSEDEQKVLIYPNPFNEFTTIQFHNPNSETYTLKLFNILGENVQIINNISENKVLLKRTNLKTGIYFFQLSLRGQIYNKGKLIIK